MIGGSELGRRRGNNESVFHPGKAFQKRSERFVTPMMTNGTFYVDSTVDALLPAGPKGHGRVRRPTARKAGSVVCERVLAGGTALFKQ